jgi:peptidoglycan-associated lipoprotein
MKHRLLLAAGLALLTAGCVTNKKFETTVSSMTSRVDGIQTTVEDQGQKIQNLDKKDAELAAEIQRTEGLAGQAKQVGTDAMTKAEAAEKAARGKVIWKVTLTNNDMRFGADDFTVTPQGAAVLDQFVERVKSFDRMVFVEIQGYTDSAGGEAYNQALGQKRADAVRDYLYEHGIPLNLMSTISFGEKNPIASNQTREGRAQNRRVELLVLE